MTLSAKFLSPRLQSLLPYIVLVAAVFAAYANVYDNAFLFDDGLIITRNTYLHSWSTFINLLTGSTTEGAHIAGGFYRPIQLLLYFFIYQLFGESTFAFHLLNIALHAANACLLFTLGRKLGFNPWASFIATLLWALHPIHTEAVTYMSATADPLFTLFCLLGLILLLPDFTSRKILLSIPLFLLALLSKETAVVFPALAIVTLYYVSPHRLKPQTYMRILPLLLVTGAYLLWRMTTSSFDGPVTYERLYQLPEFHNLKLYADHLPLRINTFFATLPAYFSLLLWPHDLHMERNFMVYADWGPPVFGGFIMCIAAGAWVLFMRGPRSLPLGWGLLWFGAAHAPDTGLLVATNALFLEHWMYLPAAGLFLGTSESLSRLLQAYPIKLKQGIAAIGIAASMALGLATLVQNMTWHDPVTFYTHIFKYGADSARARNNLALAYMDQHEFQQAIVQFHKALEISDTYAETHHNLAICLLNLPDREQHIPEAIEQLNRALAIDPKFYRSYVALTQVYTYTGDKDKADYYRHRADELLKNGSP